MRHHTEAEREAKENEFTGLLRPREATQRTLHRLLPRLGRAGATFANFTPLDLLPLRFPHFTYNHATFARGMNTCNLLDLHIFTLWKIISMLQFMKQGSVSAMGEPLLHTFLPGNNPALVNVFKTQPHAWEVVAQIFSKCFVRCVRGQRQERGYATSFTPLVSLPYISVHRNLHQFKCISNKQFYLY